MNRLPPDSHRGDEALPYRCQELRDDSDRVILGRAAPELLRRYDAHRLSCASCQHFHLVMVQAFTPPAAPGRKPEAQIEAAFQRSLGELPEARASGTRAWMGKAALVACAAACVAWFGLRPASGASPAADPIDFDASTELDASFAARDRQFRIPDRVGAFGHHAQAFGRVLAGAAQVSDEHGAPAAPQSFRAGSSIQTQGADAQFVLFGRVMINLVDGARVQWTRATHDLVELNLERGRLAVRYDREASDPVLQIRTPEVVVRVIGTVFTVEVDASGHTIVSVLRGQVQVISADSGARIADVEAGYRYDVANTTFSNLSRTEVAAALPLGESDADPRSGVPRRWVVPGLSEDQSMRSLSHVPDPRPSAGARAGSSARRGPSTSTAFGGEKVNESADESAALIAELVAQAERERRHEVQASLEHCRGLYLDAQARPRAPHCLDEFMRSYGDEPEALEGLLLIGILRMDYAHDYQAATRRFEAFLRAAPDHPRAELAMYKLTLAAIESGQIARAVQRGQAYLARYPNGQYVGHILQRFPELRDRL